MELNQDCIGEVTELEDSCYVWFGQREQPHDASIIMGQNAFLNHTMAFYCNWSVIAEVLEGEL
jgi:hypothetical protein